LFTVSSLSYWFLRKKNVRANVFFGKFRKSSVGPNKVGAIHELPLHGGFLRKLLKNHYLGSYKFPGAGH